MRWVGLMFISRYPALIPQFHSSYYYVIENKAFSKKKKGRGVGGIQWAKEVKERVLGRGGNRDRRTAGMPDAEPRHKGEHSP